MILSRHTQKRHHSGHRHGPQQKHGPQQTHTEKTSLRAQARSPANKWSSADSNRGDVPQVTSMVLSKETTHRGDLTQGTSLRVLTIC
eukprot:1150131-Pelagomonas_calceolata.AAC.7